MARRYAVSGLLALLLTLAIGLVLKPQSPGAAARVRGDMGILVTDLSPEACRAAGVQYGVLVMEVVPGGPADQKGIEEGDIITEYENQPVRSAAELLGRIRRDGEGFLAGVRINRQGSERWIGFIPLGAEPGPLPAPEALNARFVRLEEEIDDLKARVDVLERARIVPRKPAVTK